MSSTSDPSVSAALLFGDPEDPHPTPQEGDFVRSRMGGDAWARVHIAIRHRNRENGEPWAVEMSCGRVLLTRYLLPANGDQPRQCLACWESM